MNAIDNSTRADIVQSGATARVRSPRLAIIADFLEERWPSMDLFADMLYGCFQTSHQAELEVELLRPALRPRWSRLHRSDLSWNVDRLTNRFYDYPRWLQKRASEFDLFHLVDHSYAQLIHKLPAERTVVTCHDLDTFKCILEPEKEPRPRWFRAMAHRTLSGFLKAAHVICVSQFTRENLLRHGLVPAERITIINPGVDPILFSPPEADLDACIVPRGIQFMLHVGSTIRRKRIDVLLRVFSHVRREFPDIRLVRVGGDFTDAQAQLVKDLDLGAAIIQMPRLTAAQLASVYRNAALVIQPSDAEGFGLPVIEALACGCPVVASDIAPLREAGGVAAEYCPVGDIEVWAETVGRILRERQSTPADAEQRRLQARQHASGFTWTENAKRTIAVYRAVGAGGRTP